MEKQLTLKEYLGEGYVHIFKHLETGEIFIQPCTDVEYHRLGEVGGSQYNPVLEGYEWIESYGGTIKVDTPSTMLEPDQYCIKEGKVYANIDGIGKHYDTFETQADFIDKDGKIDTTKIEDKVITPKF